MDKTYFIVLLLKVLSITGDIIPLYYQSGILFHYDIKALFKASIVRFNGVIIIYREF